MTETSHLADFTQKLFDDAWQHSAVKPIGRAYACSKLEEITGFDPVEFIAHLCKTYDRRDNIGLLLSVPELWMELNTDRWLEIMRLLSPRPAMGFGDFSGGYTDVDFLVSYLKLDPIAMAKMNQGAIANEDIAKIATYCSSNADSMFLTDEDFEDMDGVILCSRSDLTKSAQKLVDENDELRLSAVDAVSFRTYAQKVIAELTI